MTAANETPGKPKLLRVPSTLVTAAVAAGCAGPSGPYPTGFGYGLPSPPEATYLIGDTVVATASLPVGELVTAGGYSLELDLTFAPDSGGVRVRGIAQTFDGSLATPGDVNLTTDLSYLSETLDFVTNRHGVARVESFPQLTGAPSHVFFPARLPHDLFPRLPDSVVDPGTTWVDTVRWHSDGWEAEGDSRAVYTYTLVGDTVVDGHSLVHIAVAGEVRLSIFTGGPGNLTVRAVKGPANGFVQWDPLRGLVAYRQYEMDLTGHWARPRRDPFPMSFRRRVRLRLIG